MVVRKNIFLSFIVFNLISIYLFSENLYKWTDSNGVVHFTDNPANIPEEYRHNVVKIESEQINTEKMKSDAENIIKDKKNGECENLLDRVILYATPGCNLKEYENSEHLFIKAMECYPESNEVKYRAGLYYFNNFNNQKALELFNKLYKSGYKREIIIVSLSEIYQRTGEYDKAKEKLVELLKSGNLGLYNEKYINDRISYLNSMIEKKEKEERDKLEKEILIKQNFEIKRSKHFEFYIDIKTSEHRRYSNFDSILEDLLENAYLNVGKDFDYYPSERIPVYLSTSETFQRVFCNTCNKIWGMYLSRERKLLIRSNSVVPDNYKAVLFHEYTHLIVDELSDFSNKYPAWLNEGLAEYEERKSEGQGENSPYAEKIALRNLINWGVFNPSSAFTSSDVRNPYLQSYAAAYFLIQKIGFRKIKNLLIDVGKGCRFEDCFQNYYNGTLHKFVKDLEEFINTL